MEKFPKRNFKSINCINFNMKFGIVCKQDDKFLLDSVKNIIALLKRKNHKVELEKTLNTLLKMNEVELQITDMTAKIILAIGDDATILRVFRDIGSKKIPILGISSGMLSFLAETDVNNFEIALKRIEQKKYSIEKRARIAVSVDGKVLPFALNELVISASRGATIVRYTLKVDKELIWRDSADGIIIATPTGSTGYALSAGGPVVSNKSNIFVVIPVCSINHNKPFVVSDNSEVVISEISSPATCEAVVDGKFRFGLDSSTIVIKKADYPALFVRFGRELNSKVFGKLRKRIETADMISKDAPPSAKFIYKILQYEGALTQKEIVRLSLLPSRTVRSALDYLVKAGLISRQTSIRDTRQSIYSTV